MRHEDGYCDRCGCEVLEPQLTVVGEALCIECVQRTSGERQRTAAKPEARDDGR